MIEAKMWVASNDTSLKHVKNILMQVYLEVHEVIFRCKLMPKETQKVTFNIAVMGKYDVTTPHLSQRV